MKRGYNRKYYKVINGESNTSDNNKWGQYNLYIRSEEIYKSNKYIFDVEGVITVGDGNIGKIFHYVNEKFDLHQRCYLIYEFQNIWPINTDTKLTFL
ncbi:hypothetical protein [Mycoplasmopsis felis]|uniref:hypothetical protein n=1 Tax=Mycoplasmopsis felis TaxID=33923 RepID=UPI0021AED52D|nr:hypothetical protein [Mycoplasmopsis felis]UWV84213.1 hypothetical protein NWE58_01710 [Mycoplasmopsis felis]